MTRRFETTPDLLNAIYALDPFQDPDFWWPVGQFPVEVEAVDLDGRLQELFV